MDIGLTESLSVKLITDSLVSESKSEKKNEDFGLKEGASNDEVGADSLIIARLYEIDVRRGDMYLPYY